MNSLYTPKETDIPAHLPKMKSLYEDLFFAGKHYRGSLVQLISSEMGIEAEQAETLARSIEFIHNSSLLHDDVVDDAVLRRGKTTAWKKYGGGYAILAGDYLLARVIKDLCKYDSIRLIEYTSETILALVEGEWLQDSCHHKSDVSLQTMEEVHRLKTGALFSWCFCAPLLLSSHFTKSDFNKLKKVGEIFGALLQRSDDLLDFNLRNHEKKEYFNDLPGGYLNLFALFLLKDISVEKRDEAFKFTELDAFVNHYSLSLDAALKAFDEESETLIADLKEVLNSTEVFTEEFKEVLLDLANKVYWRD